MSTAIHLMQGLPASGKSTYVRENFANGELVLSRDNIRKMFGATGKTVLDAGDEKKVTEVQMGLVRDAITRGVDVVKNELFDAHVAPNYNVAGVFDDRARVVNMWRTKGLRVFHVDYGQF